MADIVPAYFGAASEEFWRRVRATESSDLYALGCALQDVETRMLHALRAHAARQPIPLATTCRPNLKRKKR